MAESWARVELVMVVVVDWETGQGTDRYVRQFGAHVFGLNTLRMDPLLRSQARPVLSSVLVPQLKTISMIYVRCVGCMFVFMSCKLCVCYVWFLLKN